MMWLDDWSSEALVSEGRALLEKQWPSAGKLGPTAPATTAVSAAASTTVTAEGSPTPRAAASDSAHAQLLDSAALVQAALGAAAEMHTAMMRDQCHQLEFVGEVTDEVNLNEVRIADKKKDILKTVQLRLPNLPYSKSLLLEHIRYSSFLFLPLILNPPSIGKLLGFGLPPESSQNVCFRRNKETVEGKQPFETFVGPATFGSFLSTFAHLFTAKWNEMKVRQQRVSRLLQTLDQCRLDADVVSHILEVRIDRVMSHWTTYLSSRVRA